MLIFATSDKGGTGRSVTSSNVAYREALLGRDVCYLDFDFGSPTAGAVFQVDLVAHGADAGGLHSYLLGEAAEPLRIDVWAQADRRSLRDRPPGAGRLVLLPGDNGGGEFPDHPELLERCVTLLRRLHAEFDVCLIDLSAGRSYATQMALSATRHPSLRDVTARWLVHHRWTRQHIIGAASLVHGPRGILETGTRLGHDPAELRDRIRFVRTAVVDPEARALAGLTAEQIAWLRECDQSLRKLAQELDLGRMSMAGSVPLDPVLQWREQLITDYDVFIARIANQQTVDAFTDLAERVIDDVAWRGP
jgi:hypothetical protein